MSPTWNLTPYELGVHHAKNDHGPQPSVRWTPNQIQEYMNGYSHAYNATFKPNPQPRKCGMSKDRVRFFLREHYWITPKYFNVLQAFGLDEIDMQQARSMLTKAHRQVGGYNGLIVISRPSQFARFIVYRNEETGQNMIKELAPMLVVPGQDSYTWDVDVSREKAR